MESPDDIIIRHIIHRPGSTDAEASVVVRVAKEENTAAHQQELMDIFQKELMKRGRTGQTVTMTIPEFDDHNRKAARTPGRRSQVLAKKKDPVDRFPAVRVRAERNSEGYLVSKITNAPALPPAIDKSVWQARDASTMIANLTTFYRSVYGRAQICQGHEIMRENGYDPEQSVDLLDPDDNALAIARIFEAERTTTILAQEDFAQMLRAAALTAPNTELHRDELISPNGMLFFAQKQDLSDLIWCKDAFIRAISWWSVETLDGTSIQITFYLDGPSAWRSLLDDATANPGAPFTDVDPCVGTEDLHRFLVPVEHIYTTVDQDADSLPGDEKFIRGLGLIRSINAVSKSAHTRNTNTDTESDKQRKIRRRKGLKAPRQVRVLSLVNPDYGRYEMDAATGRKLRSHWVRGHWRQQWYPSIQGHRTIWIDGFIRGDAELGTVTGRKIYVARGVAA